MGTGGRNNPQTFIATWQQQKPVPPMIEDSDLKGGILELLSRWSGLQMAVKNKWGGQDSVKKSQDLALHLLHLFSQSNVITVEEIENLLHECLLLSFNTEIEDGSIEEVAEELMMLHEEHTRGIH